MRRDAIKEIGIDAEARLYLKPEQARFSIIYREGAEVHWDAKGAFLYSPKPREWSYLDWYEHMISVAKGDGGGFNLEITSATIWINVPEELRQQIQNLSML